MACGPLSGSCSNRPSVLARAHARERPPIRCRRRAICGPSGRIVCSAATARPRRTSQRGIAPRLGKIATDDVPSVADFDLLGLEQRSAILDGLRAKLAQGDKALVGNSGFRRYLKTVSAGVSSLAPA
jgi:hypothetical protein